MNSLGIIFSSIAVALAIWLAWLTSKPSVRPMLKPAQQKELHDKLRPNCTEGNSTKVYSEFNPMLDDLLDDIDKAESHIHMQFFKFETDYVCQRIGDALIRKAEQGVDVRLMYDHLINLKSRWYYNYLSEHGIQVVGFGPTRLPFLRKRDNYRNHRKVVVVDGHTGYLGGMNIALRYLEGLDWGPWCDTQMRIEGPAAAQLQEVFLTDWWYATGELPDNPKFFPDIQPRGSRHIEIVASGPIGNGPTIMHRTIQLLEQSKDYIWFLSPYFIPTPEVMEALCATARRGVDVRILVPGRSDRGVFILPASMSYVSQALAAGVKIGLFDSGYLHSKNIVSDDAVAHVGSTNIDPRSYLLDHEVGAFVYDTDFALEIKQLFLRDEAASHYIDPEAWPRRPIYRKITERVARIISSQL